MAEPAGRPDREAALIATAAAGELSPAEQREYDALVAADPSVARETAELRDVLARLDDLDGWQETTPDADLGVRVLGIPAAEGRRASPGTVTSLARPGRRPARWLGAAAAAVVLVVLGGVAGSWLGDFDVEPGDDPPSGPPGTLGAVEPIDFAGEPDAVDIDASLVAHTWGTETVLDMDGFEAGAAYRVVLVGTTGETEQSGTFLGSEVRIDCRMNGALLREDVDAVEIRDADGRVVAVSDVPAVAEG